MSLRDPLADYVGSIQEAADEGSSIYTPEFVRGFRHGVEMVQAFLQDSIRVSAEHDDARKVQQEYYAEVHRCFPETKEETDVPG